MKDKPTKKRRGSLLLERSRMSEPLSFHPSSSRSLSSVPQASLHTSEPRGTSGQQMAESQMKDGRDLGLIRQETNTFSMRRSYSTDGADRSRSGPAPGQGPIDSDCIYLFHQQFSGGADMASSYPELPAAPVKPPCFLSQSYPSYSSSSNPVQQVSFSKYPRNDQSNSSKYSLSTPSHQERSMHSLFPKPIYSYSVLIFMALRNSKTGSLPVSEIYSFMTEHFPYFKRAPDGWKNSVRHNLSLNKCFVKVENKNGNSSRKGCLWSLNPARVEKMQDELHKWRRKDPVTVRRSMARPECLDRLLGQKPDKFRSLPSYNNTALLSRVAPIYSFSPAQLQTPRLSLHHPHYAHTQPQQPCYHPTAAAHPNNSFVLHSPCAQPSATGSLNSPTVGKMAPVCNTTLQAEYGHGPRSMQELLLEGDTSYDIDTLNPSLTDLQLQGNLWEELREDSLVSDPQLTSRMPSTTLEGHHIHTSCLQTTPPPVCRTIRPTELRD